MLHRLSLLLLLLCSAIVAPAILVVYDMKAFGIQRFPFGNGNGFVKVFHNNRHFGTTQVKNNNSKPEWEEIYSYGNASSGTQLNLRVFDKRVGYDYPMGICDTTIIYGDNHYTCKLVTGGQMECRYMLWRRGGAAGQ